MEDRVKGKRVVFFGKAAEVSEKRQTVLEKMVEKFAPAAWERTKTGIPHRLEKVAAYKLKIEHLIRKRSFIWERKAGNKGMVSSADRVYMKSLSFASTFGFAIAPVNWKLAFQAFLDIIHGNIHPLCGLFHRHSIVQEPFCHH